MNSYITSIPMLLLSWFIAVMLPAVSIAAPRQVQVVELLPNLQAFPAGNLAIIQDLSGKPQLIFSAIHHEIKDVVDGPVDRDALFCVCHS